MGAFVSVRLAHSQILQRLRLCLRSLSRPRQFFVLFGYDTHKHMNRICILNYICTDLIQNIFVAHHPRHAEARHASAHIVCVCYSQT